MFVVPFQGLKKPFGYIYLLQYPLGSENYFKPCPQNRILVSLGGSFQNFQQKIPHPFYFGSTCWWRQNMNTYTESKISTLAFYVYKLQMNYLTVQYCCPQYFKDYMSYVNDMHRHNTRASTNNLFIPLFCTNSGLPTFYASVNRLWNKLDDSTRSITTLSNNFKKYKKNKYVVSNSKLDHLTIHKTF